MIHGYCCFFCNKVATRHSEGRIDSFRYSNTRSVFFQAQKQKKSNPCENKDRADCASLGRPAKRHATNRSLSSSISLSLQSACFWICRSCSGDGGAAGLETVAPQNGHLETPDGMSFSQYSHFMVRTPHGKDFACSSLAR